LNCASESLTFAPVESCSAFLLPPILVEPVTVRFRFLDDDDDFLREESEDVLDFLPLFLDAPPLSSQRRCSVDDDDRVVEAIDLRFAEKTFWEENVGFALDGNGDHITAAMIAVMRILIVLIYFLRCYNIYLPPTSIYLSQGMWSKGDTI